MMKQTLLPATMIMETAVHLMLQKIIAQIALVIYLRLVLLDSFHLQLAMAFALMRQTIMNANMMVETMIIRLEWFFNTDFPAKIV